MKVTEKAKLQSKIALTKELPSLPLEDKGEAVSSSHLHPMERWILSQEGQEMYKYFTGCALAGLLANSRYDPSSWIGSSEDGDKLISDACMAGWQTAVEWRKTLDECQEEESEAKMIEDFNKKLGIQS